MTHAEERSGDPISFYRKDWDPEIGLWRQKGPGHTPDTMDLAHQHAARESAWLLVAAGMDGVLDRIETGRVLKALRSMQAPEGPRRGCFRWSWEDRSITDSNGGFFTGLGLIVLYHEFGAKLGKDDHAVLKEMLSELEYWFASALEGFGPRLLRYPNRCLGDLVCAWLLAEIRGRPSPELADMLKEGAAYYRREAWGWGEHLSDIYATVCEYELTALLLYARQLEPGLKADFEWLFRDLVALDALFAGGPRVPAIRSYSLAESPAPAGRDASLLRPFLESLEPWTPAMPRRLFGPLRSLAHARGFRERYAVPPPGQTASADLRCFDGARAHVRLAPFYRFGVMSRYPIMPDTEHPDWGLSWQSMPICYWNRNGDWAFLQWEAVENGTPRAHPAFTRHHRGKVQLASDTVPLPVGETFGVRAGSSLLALRRMPRTAEGWTRLADRFRLLESSAAEAVESEEAGWLILTLDYPADGNRPRHRFRALYRPLSAEAVMCLSRPAAGRLDWEAVHSLETGDLPGFALGLWIWQAGERLPPVPLFAREGNGCRVILPDASPLSFLISPGDPAPAWIQNNPQSPG